MREKIIVENRCKQELLLERQRTLAEQKKQLEHTKFLNNQKKFLTNKTFREQLQWKVDKENEERRAR